MKSIHDDEYKLFIELLKEYRIKKNISQIELAEKLGWRDHTFVSKSETLERRLDFIEFRNICKALDVSLHTFIREFEKRLNITENK